MPLRHLQLYAKEIPFETRQANLQGLFQIFVTGPNGVKIELNHEHSEADGIKPELLFSDMPSYVLLAEQFTEF